MAKRQKRRASRGNRIGMAGIAVVVVTVLAELLEQQGTEARRLEMLEQKRRCALEEIHQREHQVCCLDCLRHDLRKKHPGKP